jgi:murein DD-endopeptidase MepM/ murein hydrolase activator NlpD
MCVKPAVDKRGATKIAMCLALTLAVGACSTASNRFGPYDQQNAVKRDPGYPQGSDDPSYTGAIKHPPGASAPRGRVTSAPLDPAAPKPDPQQVTVRQGETLYSISRRRNVPVKNLIAYNDLKAPYDIRSGQRLYLKPSGRTAQRPVARAASYRVRPGDNLYRIALNHGVSARQLAGHNNIPAPYAVRVGQTLDMPGQQRIAAGPKRGVLRITKTKSTIKPVASTSPQAKTHVKQAAVKSPRRTGPLPQPEPLSAAKFRWPVKGRIISRFGAKQGAAKNDGINIAVPAGASIKAAENGVVAYAGNELRGYGNLVLIRHADGWVTAYAHNSSLYVARGDKVKRGQIIAKAGQTGSVASPQLHFEIRRKSTAVDPMLHLSRTTLAQRRAR